VFRPCFFFLRVAALFISDWIFNNRCLNLLILAAHRKI